MAFMTEIGYGFWIADGRSAHESHGKSLPIYNEKRVSEFQNCSRNFFRNVI
jgi:hypothetical protein